MTAQQYKETSYGKRVDELNSKAFEEGYFDGFNHHGPVKKRSDFHNFEDALAYLSGVALGHAAAHLDPHEIN